jgi:hypothetical protein
VHERRSSPLSTRRDPPNDGPSLEAERFLPPDAPLWPGHWQSVPREWHASLEERVLSSETNNQIRAACARALLHGNVNVLSFAMWAVHSPRLLVLSVERVRRHLAPT